MIKTEIDGYHIVIGRDHEGWFVASAPKLQGCHTQAKSPGMVMKRIREAIKAYLGN